ncbi:MAG: NAD(P)-binding domain-containing protein [Acidobacteria bacterium]|nr:NAD(P)-binding domain-containing protein [Acidobacteriota bacterium]
MRAGTPRLVIIGGGPIGLEAALHAAERGYDVKVLEAGGVGENCRRWGHLRMFSPWGMNCSPLGLRMLGREGIRPYEEVESSPTGLEYVAHYLRPLARSPLLRGRVKEGCRVIAIGREGLTKSDRIGDPSRGTIPFHLLVERGGRRRVVEADLVIDGSGTYDRHRHPGDGGIPVPGEERSGGLIDHRLPDIMGRDRRCFADRRTLLIGSGYSAATAVVSLAALARMAPATRVLWCYRRRTDAPLPRFPNDPLPARDELAAAANRLATGAVPTIQPIPGTVLTAIAPAVSRASGRRVSGRGALRVTLRRGGETGRVEVDRILALVGYEPDRSIYAELQVHECWATSGPMKIAAALLGATGGGDCLAQPAPEAEVLTNPEPGFFILGSKSFGRNSAFLIRTGLAQIRALLPMLDASVEGNAQRQVKRRRPRPGCSTRWHLRAGDARP